MSLLGLLLLAGIVILLALMFNFVFGAFFSMCGECRKREVISDVWNELDKSKGVGKPTSGGCTRSIHTQNHKEGGNNNITSIIGSLGDISDDSDSVDGEDDDSTQVKASTPSDI